MYLIRLSVIFKCIKSITKCRQLFEFFKYLQSVATCSRIPPPYYDRPVDTPMPLHRSAASLPTRSQVRMPERTDYPECHRPARFRGRTRPPSDMPNIVLYSEADIRRRPAEWWAPASRARVVHMQPNRLRPDWCRRADRRPARLRRTAARTRRAEKHGERFP